MNHVHSTIKFTFEHSTPETSFPDMMIRIRADWKFSARLYRNTSDCAELLHFHSNHLLKCKESTFSNKSSESTSSLQMTPDYKKDFNPLTLPLLARQYPLKIVTCNISKVLLYDILLRELSTVSGVQNSPPSCNPLLNGS